VLAGCQSEIETGLLQIGEVGGKRERTDLPHAAPSSEYLQYTLTKTKAWKENFDQSERTIQSILMAMRSSGSCHLCIRRLIGMVAFKAWFAF